MEKLVEKNNDEKLLSEMSENKINIGINNREKIIRILSIIFFSITILFFIYSIIHDGFLNFFKNCAKFFTSWGYILSFTYSAWIWFKFKKENFMDLLLNITTIHNIFVTIFFWAVLFPGIKNKSNIYLIITSYIYSHCLPCLYTLALYIIGKKKQFKHINFLYIWIDNCLYGFVNIFFSVVLKEIPYPVINYKNMNSVYLLLGVFIISTIVHFILVAVQNKFKL